MGASSIINPATIPSDGQGDTHETRNDSKGENRIERTGDNQKRDSGIPLLSRIQKSAVGLAYPTMVFGFSANEMLPKVERRKSSSSYSCTLTRLADRRVASITSARIDIKVRIRNEAGHSSHLKAHA